MDILQAAKKLTGVDWNLRGDQLEQAIDDAPRVACPSKEELDAVMASVQYVAARRAAYPLVEDQLDAIWKGGSDLNEMREKILSVKRRFPKSV